MRHTHPEGSARRTVQGRSPAPSWLVGLGQAVAEPALADDVARLPGVVAELAPGLGDRAPQRLQVAPALLAPNPADQRLVGRHPARVEGDRVQHRRAPGDARALAPEASAVRLHQTLVDHQPEARAAALARAGMAAEEMGQVS